MKEVYFKTSKGDFIAVEIPDSQRYNLSRMAVRNDFYRLVCKLSEATEDYSEGIVDEPERLFNPTNPYCADDILYPNYLGEERFWFATQSLNSLLKSKGIDVNNGNLYLFKKI